VRNLAEEEIEGPTHSELWLDFAEAYGNDRAAVRQQEPNAAIRELITFFSRTAREGAPAAALAAFYAYETQVPRVAEFKESGLRKFYGAGDKASRYFWLHKTADLQHSNVWREQLKHVIAADPDSAAEALQSAEKAAKALWNALDGIEAERQSRAAAAVA
jgi:pyrroloquinoline-quinone synthase